VRFDEVNGFFVGQSGVRDVGDEIPPRAIRRMGVGFFHPIEGHLLTEGEGQCSTQVEPSPAEHPHDLNQRQAAHPQPQDHPIEPSCLESPTHEVWSIWPILESPSLDTRVSGGVKAMMKILLNSVAMGHLMIKAIQMVKARTRTVIMKMIKKFLKKLLKKLALAVRRRLKTLFDK
jgi:hypothetical protein